MAKLEGEKDPDPRYQLNSSFWLMLREIKRFAHETEDASHQTSRLNNYGVCVTFSISLPLSSHAISKPKILKIVTRGNAPVFFMGGTSWGISNRSDVRIDPYATLFTSVLPNK